MKKTKAKKAKIPVKKKNAKLSLKLEKPKKSTNKSKVKASSKIEKSKQEPKPVVKKVGLAVDVYNLQGKVIGKQNLPKEIFGAEINQRLLTQAVRVYLVNQRKGTAATKTRGKVRGGGAKPRRQKGTGRARIGSIRAPHWRGGGIVFGPQPRQFNLKLTKKMRRVALTSALSDKIQNGRILVIAGLEKIEPKTKVVAKMLANLPEKNLGKTLVVLPEKVENFERAARNLPNLNLAKATNLNVYEVLNNQTLLFLSKTVEKIEEVFGKKKAET